GPAPSRPAGDPDRRAERLEDGEKHVLRVLPHEHANVDVQARTACELLKEARDDVAREAADTLAREVDVRGDVRLVRDFEDGTRECLAGREPGPGAAARLR